MRLVQYPKPRPTLHRADAARLLSRVIARAAQINLDPARFPFAVRRLFVFGSFLTDKEVLGDLDIAAEFKLVRPTADLFDERPRWRLIHWQERTVVALHVRKPKLVSLHDIIEVRELDTETKLVFEDSRIERLPWPADG
jgi:hypothetical protein